MAPFAQRSNVRLVARRVATLVGVAMAVAAPVAAAAPRWTEIDSTSGQILDVHSDRILFKQSADALAVLDRRSRSVTPVSVAGASPTEGFLSPHGVIFATKPPSPPRLWERRDGATLDLGPYSTFGFTLKVVGDFAIWSEGGAAPVTLYRRDLAAGTTVAMPHSVQASNGRVNGSDVASNGDVAYWGYSGGAIYRFRDGTETKLSPVPADAINAIYPRTDGSTTIWGSLCSCGADDDTHTWELAGVGTGGPFVIDAFDPSQQPFADHDYRVSGGWVAFVRKAPSPGAQVWIRNPSGDETAISPTGNWRIIAMNDSGEVIYAAPDNEAKMDLHLGSASSSPLALGTFPTFFGAPGRGEGDYVYASGGRWYAVVDGTLQRLSLGDAPTDGSETSIDSAPQGVADSTTATFEFSSTVADAGFQCRLDGGAWGTCQSPRKYTALEHGQHTFLVRTVEPGGAVDPEPASQVWSVESVPPSQPPLLAPRARAHTQDRTPTLSWAAASDPGSGVDHYEVWVDGTRRASNVHATKFTPAQALPQGGHRWLVVAVDAAGNARSSATRTFTVDTTPPKAALRLSPNPALTGERVVFDASASEDPVGGEIVQHRWDLDGDGDWDRDTGATPRAARRFKSRRDIRPRVRTTDAAGNSSVASARLSVRARPPAGHPGITIERGAPVTRELKVTVGVVWTPYARSVLLSNDGGFVNAKRFPVRRRIEWTLESAGRDGTQRTVYARFLGNRGGQTYQDDIVVNRGRARRAVAAGR